MTVEPGVVGRRLLALRQAARLSMNELADLAGVHHTTVMRIESGENQGPGPATLGKLAKALGVPVAELLKESAADEWASPNGLSASARNVHTRAPDAETDPLDDLPLEALMLAERFGADDVRDLSPPAKRRVAAALVHHSQRRLRAAEDLMRRADAEEGIEDDGEG